MGELKEKLAQRFLEFGGKVSVKSAMNPIIYLAIAILAAFVCMSIWSKSGWATFAMAVCLIVVVGVAVYIFVYFAKHNPDKLQSEDYQIRKQNKTKRHKTKTKTHPTTTSSSEHT